MSPAWQIELFNAIVRPVLSYGSQVWGVDYLILPNTTGTGSNIYYPNNPMETIQNGFIKAAQGLSKYAPVWCSCQDAAVPYLQSHWFKGILRYWNCMRSSDNILISSAGKADLKLMLKTRNKQCWTYTLCKFVAELSLRLGIEVFDNTFTDALLNGSTYLSR
jgi:hypothetical protein